ncbi:hypothetical protein DFH11DRAFT_1879927 [Phellopilus nigrolimitatus]|nr:hypothetical protein DFH11DRAFT_1879927 [Phellopilus nigrolimitatus]
MAAKLSLHFSHALNLDPDDIHDISLQNVDANIAHAEDLYRATVTEVLLEWDSYTYYRATLASHSTRRTVMLIFCTALPYIGTLMEEYEDYQARLKALQNAQVIPECLGFYEGEDAEGDDVRCVLFEDCGNYVDDDISDLSQDQKVELMNVFTKVHRLGFDFADISKYNVLLNEAGAFRLINISFDDLCKHNCQWKGDWKEYAGKVCPVTNTLKCQSMYTWSRLIDFWRPDYPNVRIYDWEERIQNPDDPEYPRQKVIKALLPRLYYDHPVNKDILLAWLKKAKKENVGGVNGPSVEDYKTNIPYFPVTLDKVLTRKTLGHEDVYTRRDGWDDVEEDSLEDSE